MESRQRKASAVTAGLAYNTEPEGSAGGGSGEHSGADVAVYGLGRWRDAEVRISQFSYRLSFMKSTCPIYGNRGRSNELGRLLTAIS